MEITTELLPWSSEDESRWDSFLRTETGKRLIPKIAEQAPTLLDGGDVNKTLVRNGELRGFQESLRVLLSLSHAQPVGQSHVPSDYPDLENDAAWNDGNTLQPKK